MNRINKILYVVLTLSLLAMIASGVYAFTTHLKTGTTSTTKILRYNTYQPTGKDGAIRYYTGNTFVSYSPSDGSTKPLTTHRYIPNIQSLYWLDGGVVFSFESYASPNNLLKSIAASRPNILTEQNSQGTPYWYLSFTDNSLKPLVVDQRPDKPFAVYGNGGLLFRETETSYSILKSDGGIQREVVKNVSSEFRPIGFDDTSYYYLEKINEQIAVKKGTLGSANTMRVTNDLYASPNHSYLEPVAMSNQTIYYTNQNQLIAYNTSSGERIALTSFENGQLYQGGASDITAYINNGSVISAYTLSSGKITSQHTLQIPSYISPVRVLFENGIFYVNGLHGELVAAGTKREIIESFPTAYHDPLEKAVSSSDFALQRSIESGKDNEYIVTFIQGTTSQLLDKLYVVLQAKNIDPYQFTFILNPGPRVKE